MAHPLRRILRFRQLAEEQARLEVERVAQALSRASAACERQMAEEQRQRATLAASWNPGLVDPTDARNVDGEGPSRPIGTSRPIQQSAAESRWIMEEATLEFFGLQRVRLEQIREEESRRVESMIERYKEHRRELRQTEQLLARQAALETMEKSRRAQAETDEWFLHRSLASRRRALRRERALRKPRTAEE